MRRRAAVSSGSAATTWSPVSCAAKSAASCRTKSCRCRAPARATGRRTPFQPAACAHTWYGPLSNGGKTYAPSSSVNTDVVIGRPGGFAETVTPSSGSPDAAVTVPASSASFSPGGPAGVAAVEVLPRNERASGRATGVWRRTAIPLATSLATAVHPPHAAVVVLSDVRAFGVPRVVR